MQWDNWKAASSNFGYRFSLDKHWKTLYGHHKCRVYFRACSDKRKFPILRKKSVNRALKGTMQGLISLAEYVCIYILFVYMYADLGIHIHVHIYMHATC